MPEFADNDMLMFLRRLPGEQPLPAESVSALSTTDTAMLAGFVAGKYFEAENFTFGIELVDDEGGGADEDDPRSYARWRGLPPSQPKPDPVFRSEPEDASLTRMIDTSSPILLKHCLDGNFFHEAVLVKRARHSATGAMVVVLRMEFSKVWLRSIEWEDGDAVRENLKFKFAKVAVTYVPRKPDGTPGTAWRCAWDSEAPASPPQGGGRSAARG